MAARRRRFNRGRWAVERERTRSNGREPPADKKDSSVADIMPWMSWCTPEYNEELAREWLATLKAAWKARVQYGMVITDAHSGTILGGTGLNHINYFYRLANLGYWVRSSATRHGIATRTARLVGEFAVKQVGLLRAEIVVAVDNEAKNARAEQFFKYVDKIEQHRNDGIHAS